MTPAIGFTVTFKQRNAASRTDRLVAWVHAYLDPDYLLIDGTTDLA